MTKLSFQRSTYWENGNSSCYIDFNLTTPCEQGVVPAMVLDARSITDVQKGVNFAREHQLRLRIKSSGHDISLALVPDFVPTGAPIDTKPVKAIRSGPGDRWTDLYDLANRSDIVVVGGTGQTVSSAGGYLMGGGHSPLSRHYGLAVDNVLQFVLVDASGSEVIANAYRNPDLFWSLRGGGGGTFGVVTEVIQKTHPPFHNILGATLTISASNSTDFEEVLKVYLDSQPSLDDAQWCLTTAVQQTSFILQAILFAPPPGANLTQVAYQAFRSIILAAQNLSMTSAFVVQEFPNFLALHDAFFPPTTPSGSPAVIASRLIPRHIFENTTATALLAHAATEPPMVIFNLLAGGAVSEVSPTATSVNPGWRKALHHVIFATGWTSSTPLAIRDDLRQTLTAQTALLEPFNDGLGAYLNEADRNDPDWPQSFWGANYERLLEMKHKFDPLGVFECPRCVGSEVFGF
ncbi:FAD-binding domain-containing protein [Mycena sanguinolenta]|uniref:FAD-binding domain-containing protein n=1 Tax=Mycena sanguinolenta TaxID=230812 RepID=A0A8H7DHS5_9AGAR|nr:FAD-binding domain-containing protein [Mycena sanguinolenta]